MKKFLPASEKKKTAILYACMLLIVFLMTGASELFQEKDIIFPEIMAIATGSILSPTYAWRTSKKRLLLSITICAVCGLLLERFCPGPLPLQLLIAFFLAQVVFLLSRTSFAPMISATAMPVFLHTGCIVYLISAVVFTCVILGFNLLLEHCGLKTDPGYTPLQIEKRDVYDLLKRSAVMAVIILLVFRLNIRFAVAPPLLVAFMRFSSPSAPCRQKPARFIGLLFFCALAGSMSRLLFSEHLKLPLLCPALIAFLIVILIMDRGRIYFPPAAALTMLSFLIPDRVLPVFSLQILAGSVILMICGILFFRPKKERKSPLYF